MKKILCLIMCAVVFCGCLRKNQIDKLSFVKIIGIDKANDKIVLSVGIEGADKKSSTAHTECNSIFEGVSLLEAETSENIFFGQVEAVLLGYNYGSDNISEAIDFFTNSNNMRFDIPVIAVKNNSAQSIIESTDSKDSVYKKIERLLESASAVSTSGKVSIKDLVSASGDRFSSPYLPYIEGNAPLSLGGYCLLRENKISCFLNEEQSKGLNILADRFENLTLSTDYNNKNISAQIDKIKTEIKYENGIFYAKIKCEIKPKSSLDDKEYSFLKQYVFSTVKGYAEEAIEEMQKYASDGAGIGKVFYLAAPKIAKNTVWKDVFSQITVKIDIGEYK